VADEFDPSDEIDEEGDSPSFLIKPLTEKSETKNFSCGVSPEIDKWFKEKALKLNENRRAKTFLAKDGYGNTVGFYSLSIEMRETHSLTKGNRDGWSNIPLIYIYYLAVKRSCQGQKIGTRMLIDAFRRTREISKHTVVWGIGLRSLDERSSEFYAKNDFAVCKKINGEKYDFMVISIWEIEEILKGLD
jgi:GNAT superfamily N-acetyltransferase